MRPALRACALPLLVLATALPGAAHAAKRDKAPLPAGYNLMDVFVEACLDAEMEHGKAVKALEKRGAIAMPASERGAVSLQWFARAERLMVTYGPGMCAVSTDSADRDASLRDLLASRPDDATPLPRGRSGVPQDWTYLVGFEMRSARKDGGTTGVEVIAFQHDDRKPVLTLMSNFGRLPADALAPVPFAAPMPLATAGDVVAFFDTACVQTRADEGAAVDIALLQNARWLGADAPRMLSYALGAPENAVSLSVTPGACGVAVRHLPGAELLPAMEALVATWAEARELPEAGRPDFGDMPLLFAREGHLAADRDKPPMRVVLVGPAKGSSQNQYMLMIQQAMRVAE